MKKWYWISPSLFIAFGLMAWGAIRFATPPPFDWKTYEAKDFGLSLESPFPLKWEVKDQVTQDGKPFRSLWGMSKLNFSGALVTVSSFQFPKGDLSLRSDDQLRNFAWTLQHSGYVEPRWESHPVTCSGLPATLTTGSYVSGNDPCYFQSLLVLRKNQLWTIEASHKVWDKDSPVQTRVIASVKIIPNP